MMYPTLDFFAGGGGLLIAVIAVLHVYVAHFAVGGGLFLVLTEWKARKKDSTALLAYTRQSTQFFLLLTMVFGGLSGVAIWFTIGILSPDATGKLIETFLFAWAAEWVFFSVEITALLIYWYRFDTLNPAQHMAVGWIYFASAWLSLFIINGVISFMLTPGVWLETGRFVDAFFNPSFWPSLLFRTAMAIWCAGLFGYVTAAFSKEDEVKAGMHRFYTFWVVGMGCLVFLSGKLYLASVPGFHLEGRYEEAASISQLLSGFAGVTVAIMTAAAFMGLFNWQRWRRPVTLLVLASGLLHMGLFEMVREHARKPWLIPGVLYANSLSPADLEASRRKGLRSISSWMDRDGEKTVTGRALFRAQCLACHSVGGPIHDITPLTARYTPEGLEQVLAGQGGLHQYMPPFFGDDIERRTLARWLTSELHGRRQINTQEETNPPEEITAKTAKTPVLLAWRNTTGNARLHSAFFRSGNKAEQSIQASLIRKGEFPEVVTEGPDITVSASGNEFSMAFEEEKGVWALKTDEGTLDATCLVTATEGGELLNQVALPAEPSFTQGCFHCHGGEVVPSGIGDSTAMNILAAHDKNCGTQFIEKVKKGSTIACARCHTGKRPSPSAALHGWHNAFMADKDERSCRYCHSSGPHAAPEFFSGRHRNNQNCTNCHGTLTQHAAGLLKPFKVPEVQRMKMVLGPESHAVTPRAAYTQFPSCLSCHEDFEPANTGGNASMTETPEERFSAMKDDMEALACGACHGRAHELAPATRQGVNAQSVSYMGKPGVMGSITCTVCHEEEMEDEAHHMGMLKNR